MGDSSIEWTEKTWNPVRGCIKASPGCKHCYAETFAERWRGIAGHPYEQGFDPRLVPGKLGEPLLWRKPCTVFVNSMSDLFGGFVPDDYVAAVFGVMAATPQHTYQVLTKRAERLPQWFEWVTRRTADGAAMFGEDDAAWRTWQMLYVYARRAGAKVPAHHGGAWPLPNVHLGVSVEDRKYGLPRIDHLRTVPAALRFLSIEPLLEDLGEIDLTGIGWVIVGGESGNGARPMNVNWIRRVMWNCRAQKVPVFVKQLGANPHNGLTTLRVRAKGGDMAEWPEDLRVREMPEVRA